MRNGQTPQGVYTVDSVMPKANDVEEYGRNRRLILNFISKYSDLMQVKALIPGAHHHLHWWKEAIVAADIGRTHLRIHGTGRKNFNFLSSHFPFVSTSGCLSMRETFIHNDQRLLLNALMGALELPLIFESETKIQGLLYVVEFDGNDQALRF